MLCDLFVEPAAHGRGCGRAMLAELWSDATRKMTFSSLHSHAAPLYTSFGLDAWWPLLYLGGDPGRLPVIEDWTLESVSAVLVAKYERDWTGRRTDRRARGLGGQGPVVHRFWSVAPVRSLAPGPSSPVERTVELCISLCRVHSRRWRCGWARLCRRLRPGRRGPASADRARVPAGAAPCGPRAARGWLAVRRVRPFHGYRASTPCSVPAPRSAVARPGLTMARGLDVAVGLR